MQLVELIEKRRFVGREFLLWLWFESEIFDATLQTREHGEFGLWLESRLTLSFLKESTRIIAPMPGLGVEAKAALQRGQLPESAGLRIAYKDAETGFTLNAERLAFTGLRLATMLDQVEEEAPNPLLEAPRVRKGGRGKSPEAEKDLEAEQDAEAFYERMRLTSEIEELLSTLYRDFLALRLNAAWEQQVVPLLRRFAASEDIDADAYRALRRRLVKGQAAAGSR